MAIINEMHEIFYHIKNETEDKIIDDSLIKLMREYFEGPCGGSSELLKGMLTTFAEDLLNSIFYCIDAGVLSHSSNEQAFDNIKSGSARQVYEQGLARVTACYKESQVLYKELRKNRLKVGLEAYDLTIDEGLGIFFEKIWAGFPGTSYHGIHRLSAPFL